MTILSSSNVSLDFADALDQKFCKLGWDVGVVPGRVYDRIVVTDPEGTRALHAYIKRATSELIEPQSWAKPKTSRDGSLAVRFLLSNTAGWSAALEAADIDGSYLTEH